MPLHQSQSQSGQGNSADPVWITRRQLLTGAVAVPSAAAMYYGYHHLKGEPVKAGLIGTGNQGCQIHIGESNPEFIKIVAFSDVRPSNQARARGLFRDKYGAEADQVRLYEDYNELLERDDIELIIIALPLFLHAPVSIAAMKAGKHVLCEKLMAGTVSECKAMVRTAEATKKFLAIGHQRHYSYMYANALALIRQDLLGEIRHIRAYWHRNQTNSGEPGAEMGTYDSWYPAVPPEDARVDFAKHGYDSLNQLVRWRIDKKTGGGLMVELGSHQLDACSIFLQHALPTAVSGVGKISFFKNDRQVWDHVFLTYEYGEKANNAVVTYSSICTNAFDYYGEQVMGTRGTLILQREAEAYVLQEAADPRNSRINWAEARVAIPMAPVADTGSTKQWGAGVRVGDTIAGRGFREEQEHMAWLIRNVKTPDASKPELMPRCHGEVGMKDAVVTLVSNLCMDSGKRVEFKDEWFDYKSDAAPEDDPDVTKKA